MDDKMLMEGLLWNTKSMADLCMHGTIESGTKNVHEAFQNALKEILSMQNEIYETMSNEGWYQPEEVEQTKIDQIKQKFKPFCCKEEE